MTAHYTTFSGKSVNLLNLSEVDICIGDIAHHLACVNRFGGAARRPVSVAQHSVYVSRLCGPQYALQGLLHDASEAYLGDVTKWIKASPAFAAYRELEDRLQRIIFRKYGCPEEQHESVTWADRIMVRHEFYASMQPGCRIPHPDYGPLREELSEEQAAVLQHWSPEPWEIAERRFITEFRRLFSTLQSKAF